MSLVYNAGVDEVREAIRYEI